MHLGKLRAVSDQARQEGRVAKLDQGDAEILSSADLLAQVYDKLQSGTCRMPQETATEIVLMIASAVFGIPADDGDGDA